MIAAQRRKYQGAMSIGGLAMIILVHGSDPRDNGDIIDKMFQLRARAFNDRLGWKVRIKDGREKDEFDEINPLYVIVTNKRRDVTGSLRLLPTTGPHMLADVFSELVESDSIIRSPRVLESSRFVVDTDAVSHLPNGLSAVTGELLCGAFEATRAAGIEFFISVFDVRVERILRRVGCQFDRLCEPKKIGEIMTVVGLFETNAAVTLEIRARNNLTGSLFADPEWMTALSIAA
jgi:N-acyl-L-homoserine lactone synthetase